MARVVFSGWDRGLSKIKLNKLLRQHCGMTLSAAKDAVDTLLEGRSIECETEDEDQAKRLAEKARALGVIVDE